MLLWEFNTDVLKKCKVLSHFISLILERSDQILVFKYFLVFIHLDNMILYHGISIDDFITI